MVSPTTVRDRLVGVGRRHRGGLGRLPGRRPELGPDPEGRAVDGMPDPSSTLASRPNPTGARSTTGTGSRLGTYPASRLGRPSRWPGLRQGSEPRRRREVADREAARPMHLPYHRGHDDHARARSPRHRPRPPRCRGHRDHGRVAHRRHRRPRRHGHRRPLRAARRRGRRRPRRDRRGGTPDAAGRARLAALPRA